MIVITPLGIILGNYKFLIPFNVISEEFNKNKATGLEFTTKLFPALLKLNNLSVKVLLVLTIVLKHDFDVALFSSDIT
jgi:hypothetical protein